VSQLKPFFDDVATPAGGASGGEASGGPAGGGGSSFLTFGAEQQATAESIGAAPAGRFSFGAGASLAQVASGPVVAVVMLVLGGGGVYGMKMLSQAAAVSGEEVSFEYESALAGPSIASRMTEALAGLDSSARPVQVPADPQARDPFRMGPATALAADDGSWAAAERSERERMMRAEEERRQREEQEVMLAEALGRITLQGVVGGRRPLARINGETVKVGDTVVDGIFKVDAIDGRAVVLRWNERRWRLRYGQGPEELP
jgi:hypothetical protein